MTFCQVPVKGNYRFVYLNFEAFANWYTWSRWFIERDMKNCCFCCLVLAYFCFVSWFLLMTCFFGREIFSSKKNKQAWNCLDNLIILYYLRVPLSTHLPRIHLYALIFICDHLWESLLFMKIFLNLFLFMIICENLFF